MNSNAPLSVVLGKPATPVILASFRGSPATDETKRHVPANPPEFMCTRPSSAGRTDSGASVQPLASTALNLLPENVETFLATGKSTPLVGYSIYVYTAACLAVDFHKIARETNRIPRNRSDQFTTIAFRIPPSTNQYDYTQLLGQVRDAEIPPQFRKPRDFSACRRRILVMRN